MDVTAMESATVDISAGDLIAQPAGAAGRTFCSARRVWRANT